MGLNEKLNRVLHKDWDFGLTRYEKMKRGAEERGVKLEAFYMLAASVAPTGPSSRIKASAMADGLDEENAIKAASFAIYSQYSDSDKLFEAIVRAADKKETEEDPAKMVECVCQEYRIIR